MMKKLIPYFALLTIYGCDALPISSFFVSPSNSNSTVSSASGCSDKPTVELREKDVEEISLNEKTLTKSSQASATKAIGYKFAGESGQKFTYQTDQTLCIWIYSPDNEIISGGTLPKSGNYIIQVSAPKGSTTFDLNMSLGVLQASTPPPVQPTNNYTPPVQPTNNYTPPVQPTSDYTPPASPPDNSSDDLTQDEALSLVARWYSAKPRIFGPPFDRELLSELSTGRLYKRVNGSIDWLEKYNRYYTYNRSEITKVVDFSNYGSRPYIKIRVLEELYLHGKEGIDRTNSGTYQLDYIYVFAKENGAWKIYSNEKI